LFPDSLVIGSRKEWASGPFLLPSPLYSGERGHEERGRRGHTPSPPTPLPRVQGRGEQANIPLAPEYRGEGSNWSRGLAFQTFQRGFRFARQPGAGGTVGKLAQQLPRRPRVDVFEDFHAPQCLQSLPRRRCSLDFL